MFQLSDGVDPVKVASDASLYFMSAAKNPGLDVSGVDTYTYASDLIACLKNIIEYLSRTTLLHLSHIQPRQLSYGSDITWNFMSTIDDSGVLHRWKTVDSIPSDPIEQLHGWEVFGDMAALEAPMTLHLIAIGRRDGSHQRSPWCKTYAHPTVANTYKFQKVSGDELSGKQWRPVYFAANNKNTPSDWVDWMQRDKAIDPLIQHINVSEVSKYHVSRFYRDVAYEYRSMKEFEKTDIRLIPMSNYACDKPYICPHQSFCYNESVTLDQIGVYSKVKRADKELV